MKRKKLDKKPNDICMCCGRGEMIHKPLAICKRQEKVYRCNVCDFLIVKETRKTY